MDKFGQFLFLVIEQIMSVPSDLLLTTPKMEGKLEVKTFS